MPLSPPGAAPLRVQAAAAASLLAEGVLPEDVGAAAGLANPTGGEYTPEISKKRIFATSPRRKHGVPAPRYFKPSVYSFFYLK